MNNHCILHVNGNVTSTKMDLRITWHFCLLGFRFISCVSLLKIAIVCVCAIWISECVLNAMLRCHSVFSMEDISTEFFFRFFSKILFCHETHFNPILRNKFRIWFTTLGVFSHLLYHTCEGGRGVFENTPPSVFIWVWKIVLKLSTFF